MHSVADRFSPLPPKPPPPKKTKNKNKQIRTIWGNTLLRIVRTLKPSSRWVFLHFFLHNTFILILVFPSTKWVFFFKDMHFFFWLFSHFFFLKHNIPLTGLSIHCRSTNVRGQPIANLSIFSAHVNVGRVWLVLVGFFLGAKRSKSSSNSSRGALGSRAICRSCSVLGLFVGLSVQR